MPERLQPAELDRELTPIEESRAATGRRHLELTPDAYDALAAKLNADHGNPREVGRPWQTLRAVPEWEDVQKDATETKALLSLAERQVDAVVLDDAAVKAGLTERTKKDHDLVERKVVKEPTRRE